MEIQVAQGTDEWLELRQCVSLTASKFADAIGAGYGLPYDYLCANITTSHNSQDRTHAMKHGIKFEPIIKEAYELLTGLPAKPSGFWIPTTQSMGGIAGASPDAKVYNSSDEMIGIAEFKAPVHCMYKADDKSPHGIPRRYMAQVQGQMGVCGQPWCDFMAICTTTKEVMLKRVYFNERYWKTLQNRLTQFSQLLKEAKKRQQLGFEALDFPAARNFKQKSKAMKLLIPGEKEVRVDQLLETDSLGRFRSKRNVWFSYQFLVGEP